MGRKGVSKRKSSQKKGKQLPGDNASGGVSSIGRVTERQPGKLAEPDKAVIPVTRGSDKQSSDSKKKSKKR